ncbi:rod shape-determining protein RodA [Marinobacter sp. AC-23]|nr:rod shape-determining protein RodA [Marinobacter sp. AC-23]
MNRIAITLCSALLIAPVSAFAESMISDAPENAEVYFVQPSDGATVEGTFDVVFGLRNMGVAPAGVDKEGTGHHHLLIDTEVPSDLSKPLPATDQIKHFGGGQTETEITLQPGEHTLQLLIGNYAHVPHSQPVVSEQITVTVE